MQTIDSLAEHSVVLAVDEVLYAAISGTYSGFLTRLWRQLRSVFPQCSPRMTHSHLDIGPFGAQAQDLARRLVRWHGGGLSCERGLVRGAFRICCRDEDTCEETMLLELEDLAEGWTVMGTVTVLERAGAVNPKGDSAKREPCEPKSPWEGNTSKDTPPPVPTSSVPANSFRILKRTVPPSQQQDSLEKDQAQGQQPTHNSHPTHQLSDLKSEQYEQARAEIFKDHQPEHEDEEDEEDEDEAAGKRCEGEKSTTVASGLNAHAVPFVPKQPLGHVLQLQEDVKCLEDAHRIASQWNCCLRLYSLFAEKTATFSSLAVFSNAQAADAALAAHPDRLARLSIRFYR